MEYQELKGSTGFVLTWFGMAIFSSLLFLFDWKVAVLGFLCTLAFAFLGFDMFDSLIKSQTAKARKKIK